MTARLRFSWTRAKGRLVRFKRPGLILARVVLAAALCAGVVPLAQLIEQHVRQAPAFSVTVIEVHGAKHLSRDEVLQRAGLALGQNVFEQAPDKAQRLLSQHPWVASAVVKRRLPGSYQITLREHRAVAVLALEALYLVADDGAVFKQAGDGDPLNLPVITGVDPQRFAADRTLRASLLLNAVALLHDYREAGLWRREPIQEIHVEPNRGLSLYVGLDPTFVRLGKRPYRRKLRRLRSVFGRLHREDRRAAYVYLDNERRPDRVTVRLR